MCGSAWQCVGLECESVHVNVRGIIVCVIVCCSVLQCVAVCVGLEFESLHVNVWCAYVPTHVYSYVTNIYMMNLLLLILLLQKMNVYVYIYI